MNQTQLRHCLCQRTQSPTDLRQCHVLNEVTPGKRDTFGIYSGLIFYACENQYERITEVYAEVFIGDKVPSELVSKCGGN